MVVKCPRCRSSRVSRNPDSSRFDWKCDMCKREFNVNDEHYGESVMKDNLQTKHNIFGGVEVIGRFGDSNI